jgi:hypothetical protein
VCFLGPKAYLGGVVTVVTAMRCGVSPARMQRLKGLVGVSRQTVLRWQQWWHRVLPETRFWRGLSGTLRMPVAPQELPLSLLEQFCGSVEDRLVGLLRLLAPLTAGKRGARLM